MEVAVRKDAVPKLVQPENAELPIEVDIGINAVPKLVQPEKALSPMEVRSGKQAKQVPVCKIFF
jgi:hypothetical protein